MSEKDYAVGVTAGPITIGTVSKKPPYLITLKTTSTKSPYERFISLDKPEHIVGFIQVKGVFSLESEDVILKDFLEILNESPKENIIEIMFPEHRVHSIRNLIFRSK